MDPYSNQQIDQIMNDETKDQKFAFIRLMSQMAREPVAQSIEAAVRSQQKNLLRSNVSTRNLYEPFDKRMAKLEKTILIKHQIDKAYNHAATSVKVVNLHNKLSCTEQTQKQKELLRGSYELETDMIIKLAEEPLMYHLYKRRDFHNKSKTKSSKLDL